jgi:glycosyltransferase involved in cell wall biosynthesis
LVIVGAGGGWLEQYVRRLKAIARELGIADDVLSTGSVSRSELRAYYQTASVLACASLHEGFCIPLIEAMALRVPVLALARTAVPETVGDGGLLVEKTDPTTFARALADVITDKELRQRLIEQGRKRYERHYAPRLLRRQFLDAVAPLLDSPGLRVAGFAKQTSQVAVIGWNTPQGLGYVNRDLARHLPIARWLLPTHPGFRELDAPETPVVRVSQQSGHWEMRRAVEGLDWLVFCERPYVWPIVATAHEQGARIACIPMWEYLLEDLPWLRHVDLMICPTEACYAMLREWKERLGFAWEVAYVPWPVDTTRFRFRERSRCERFLFCNGSGGHRADLRGGGRCGPRKGIDIVAAAAKLAPNIPIVVRTQRPVERDATPQFPPNVEVVYEAHDNEELYERGDVAIQPSRWEGLGLQLLECQAAGLPLITTDAAPMNEYEPLVRLPAPTRQVRLFGPRWIDAHEVAPADLAAAMRAVYGRDIRDESHAARAFIERRHSWTVAGPILKRLLGL